MAFDSSRDALDEQPRSHHCGLLCEHRVRSKAARYVHSLKVPRGSSASADVGSAKAVRVPAHVRSTGGCRKVGGGAETLTGELDSEDMAA